MATEWYYSRGGHQHGPLSWDELHRLAASEQLLSNDHVWTAGMADWQLASQVEGLFPGAPPPPPERDSGKRIAAGVLAILLGSLGIHKFMLGQVSGGMILLLATILTCGIAAAVTQVIGVIEGIIYLTKSDEEFYQDYFVNHKAWF